MRKYELMMIIDPTVSDDDRATLLSEVKAELTTHEASVVSEDIWGVRPLAYKIHGSATGFYALFTLESSGRGLIAVAKEFNLKKALWRHMFTRIDE